MSYNHVTLEGFCGADPLIKNFEGGGKAASFSLATTDKGYKTKEGKIIPDRTDWHNIVVKGGLAKVVEGYVKKGSQLLVAGSIRNRSYENKEGQKVFVTEIHADVVQLLGTKQSSNNQEPERCPNHDLPPEPGDDLPF